MFRKSSGIALVLLYFALGLVHFLNQSYAKLNNHDLVACVFPRFGLFGYFCYCFFLPWIHIWSKRICLSSLLLWFSFYDTLIVKRFISILWINHKSIQRVCLLISEQCVFMSQWNRTLEWGRVILSVHRYFELIGQYWFLASFSSIVSNFKPPTTNKTYLRRLKVRDIQDKYASWPLVSRMRQSFVTNRCSVSEPALVLVSMVRFQDFPVNTFIW